MLDEKLLLETAEKINVILHNGAITATDRGKVISALILSMAGEAEPVVDPRPVALDSQPNLTASPADLVAEINARVKAVLQREGTPAFYDHIRLALPATPENHSKFKTALVLTIRELNSLNIRPAMNSGTDVLGHFYEVFLQYGNWAKEIGIVLTPRHVAAFAAEIMDITARDIVFDPTCGTGGFLVSAFDYVKQNSTKTEVENFKCNNIFGIEQEPSVVALAIVNMIFRGDGRNNIREGNCFHQNITPIPGTPFVPAVTKVLMNPPFALSTDKEYKFVTYALTQMQHGGLLFAIVPTAVFLQKGQYKSWREEMLRENSLLAVITLPSDVFYGANAGTNTVAVVIKRGFPHDPAQNVLWLRAIKDGFVKRKGKRLKPKHPLVERDMLTEYKDRIKQFIKNQSRPDAPAAAPEALAPPAAAPEALTKAPAPLTDIPEECKICPIDFTDSGLELVPEYYLDEKIPDCTAIKAGIETLVRETAGYLLTTTKQDVVITANAKTDHAPHGVTTFNLTRLCTIERKYAPYLNEVLSDQKTVPYVTTTEMNNGISLKCDSEPNFKRDTITVSLDGTCGTTFYQFEDYIAGEKTAALTLLDSLTVPADARAPLLFYLAYLIRHKSWRFHFGRKLSEERLRKFEIALPIDTNGSIDFGFIKSLVENCYGWSVIQGNL